MLLVLILVTANNGKCIHHELALVEVPHPIQREAQPELFRQCDKLIHGPDNVFCYRDSWQFAKFSISAPVQLFYQQSKECDQIHSKTMKTQQNHLNWEIYKLDNNL